MREGVARATRCRKVLAERTLPQLDAHIVAKPEDSLYWGPVAEHAGGVFRARIASD